MKRSVATISIGAAAMLTLSGCGRVVQPEFEAAYCLIFEENPQDVVSECTGSDFVFFQKDGSVVVVESDGYDDAIVEIGSLHGGTLKLEASVSASYNLRSSESGFQFSFGDDSTGWLVSTDTPNRQEIQLIYNRLASDNE